MFVTTKGIVLRVYPFKDKNCISKVFTEEYGLISFIVRKSKNQIILSQVFTVAEITFKKSNKQLFYVKEAHVHYAYHNLMLNQSKLQCSFVLCDILNKCLKEPNISIYKFIVESLRWLDNAKNYVIGYDSLFLIKFCQQNGISPFSQNNIHKNKYLNISEGVYTNYGDKHNNNIVPLRESVEINILSQLDFQDLFSHKLSQELNESILNYMILYISTHLTDLKNIKSIKLLKKLV